MKDKQAQEEERIVPWEDQGQGERELPNGGVIHDRRSDEEKKATIGFIVGTDRVMSGWGKAEGGMSYFAIPVRTSEEWDETLSFMHGRNDMLRVREVGKDYRPRLRAGDHLSIRRPRGSWEEERKGGES